MLLRPGSLLFFLPVLLFAGTQISKAVVSDQARAAVEARDAQRGNASPAVLLQQSGGNASKKDFTRVTIKQLRADPKTFAQQNVSVSGRMGESSQTDQYFELLQDEESLRVLIESLPKEVQARIYAAKPGSRVSAYGQFSGYVLFGARVDLGK